PQVSVERHLSMLLRRKLWIESEERLRCRFAQRQTRIARAGGFTRVVDRDLAGDLGKQLVDFVLVGARGHVASLGSTNSRNSSGGPSEPSLKRGVTRKLPRSRIHPEMTAPGGPRSPFGPAMPRCPCFAISCQPAPGHGPGLSLRATKLPPSSTTMSPRA